MTRWIAAAVLAVSMMARGEICAASETGRAYGRSTTVFVNGSSCGVVRNWRGGDMRVVTRAVATPGGAGTAQTVSEIRCAPLSFEIPFPPSPPLTKLIQDMFAGVATRATIVVGDVQPGQASADSGLILELPEAMLTEIRFPMMPTTAREPAYVTLVFQAPFSRTLEKPPLGETPPEASRKVTIGGVQLVIPGIDARGFGIVEPFTVTCKLSQMNVGGDKFKPSTEMGATEITSLMATMNLQHATDFSRWRNDAVNAGSPLPRDGTLTLLDGQLKPVAIFQLTSVGMVGVGVAPTQGPDVRKVQVELSCRQIRLEVPPPPRPPAAAARGA